MEVSIDGSTGRVTVRYTEDGKEQVDTEQIANCRCDVRASGWVPYAGEEHRARGAGNDRVDGGGDAETAACEAQRSPKWARVHSRRKGLDMTRLTTW